MHDADKIDRIFAEALACMAPSDDGASADDHEKEQTVNADDNNYDYNLPPADAADDSADLDTLLENLTSGAGNSGSELPDEDALDNVLNEMFPGGSKEADPEPEPPAAMPAAAPADNSIDELMSTAMSIEDMPMEDAAALAESAATADFSAVAGGNAASDDDGDEDYGSLEETLLAAAEEDDDDAAALDDAVLDSALKSMEIESSGESPAPASGEAKERLMAHLAARFDVLARRKLQTLTAEQVKLVKSVNLRVDIELKFGDFSASGDDDSVFQID